MKIIYLSVIWFFIFWFIQIFAFNSNNIVNHYEDIIYNDSLIFTLSWWQDFILEKFCVINKNWSWNILLIDDSITFLNKDFNIWECFDFNWTVIKNDLTTVNLTSDLIWIFFQWYLINENDDVNYEWTTWEDNSKRIIDFVVLVIFVVAIWKVILSVSYFFRK